MKERIMGNQIIVDVVKPGQRVRLLHMEDPFQPVPDGTEGTVEFIDDAGQIHMKWDNGRSLALIPSVDQFTTI